MKEIIIINKPHSVIDVITNSSTEIFVVKKENIVTEIVHAISEDIYPYDDDRFDLLSYDSMGDKSEIWCNDEIDKRLKERKLTYDDVLIFEFERMPRFKEIFNEYFDVIFYQHD